MPPATAPRFAESTAAMRAAFDDAFGDCPAAPLAAFDPAFRELDVDPFDLFLLERILPREGQLPETVEDYRRAVGQWEAFMADADRHPACPRASHVRAFERELRADATGRTGEAERTLRRLGRAYRFWQREPALPHGDEDDPFATVLTECERR